MTMSESFKLHSFFDQSCIHFLNKVAFTFRSKLHSLKSIFRSFHYCSLTASSKEKLKCTFEVRVIIHLFILQHFTHSISRFFIVSISHFVFFALIFLIQSIFRILQIFRSIFKLSRRCFIAFNVCSSVHLAKIRIN